MTGNAYGTRQLVPGSCPGSQGEIDVSDPALLTAACPKCLALVTLLRVPGERYLRILATHSAPYRTGRVH